MKNAVKCKEVDKVKAIFDKTVILIISPNNSKHKILKQFGPLALSIEPNTSRHTTLIISIKLFSPIFFKIMQIVCQLLI